MSDIWAVIPVKEFNGAKHRLSGLLSPPERRLLAETMLTPAAHLTCVAATSATSRPTVCSAAETTLDSGALATTIPRLVAMGTSTLSTPTPARPTARRRVALASRSPSSLVAERIRIPS